MFNWGKQTRRCATVVAAVAVLAGLFVMPSAQATAPLPGPALGPVQASAQVAAADEGASCANTPTVATELRAPYLPPEAEAELQAVWAARQQPADAQFSYLVYVPASVPEGPVPLVVTVHGLTGTAKQHLAQTNWQTVADEHGFVVVAPNGHRRWDYDHESLDIRFVRDVIADMRTRNCIDASRIYVTGHSNGAFMTHRAACEMGDLVAAGASYAAGDVSGGGPCPSDGQWPDGTTVAGWERVPLGLWHGTNDTVIGYPAGRRGLRKWLERHDCDTTPTTATDAFGSSEVYGNCLEDVTVSFRTLNGHGHAWPDGCGGNNTGTGGNVDCEPAPGTGPFPKPVDLARDGAGLGATHPVCPTSNAGPGTQSMEGRTVTVSAEDTFGQVVSVDVITEPVVVTAADGRTEHVEAVRVGLPGHFHPNRTVVRASYAGDVVKFWWGCGTPPARYKETITPGRSSRS